MKNYDSLENIVSIITFVRAIARISTAPQIVELFNAHLLGVCWFQTQLFKGYARSAYYSHTFYSIVYIWTRRNAPTFFYMGNDTDRVAYSVFILYPPGSFL